MDGYTLFDLYLKKKQPENCSSDSSSTSSNESLSSLFFWDTSDSDSDYAIEEDTVKRKRREGYLEHTVPSYTDEEFKHHFRLDRAVVEYVEMLIAPAFVKNAEFPGGKPCIGSNTALHLFLWYIGKQESFRQVCHRFNVSESTAHRLVHKVSKKIASLKSHFINFPSQDQFKEISRNFHESKGIFRVIGVLGVLRIFIKKPKLNPEDYFNKNGYNIILQGICDVTKRFIDVYVGEPGSSSETQVLQKSPIYKSMAGNPNCLNNYCIIAGQGYPLLNWLVPPFRNKKNISSSGQMHFNSLHDDTRELIDDTYKILTNRFRRLQDFENSDLDLICQCILSACILHNICLQMGDSGEDFLEDGCHDTNFEVVSDASSDKEVLYKL